jgi:hypothetical protein
MDIELDMNVLGLDQAKQEALKHKTVNMTCPNGHQVPVRLKSGVGASTIYCPSCREMVEPRLPEDLIGERSATAE